MKTYLQRDNYIKLVNDSQIQKNLIEVNFAIPPKV